MNIIRGRTFSVDKENCLLHWREGCTTFNLSLTIDGSISFPFYTLLQQMIEQIGTKNYFVHDGPFAGSHARSGWLGAAASDWKSRKIQI